MALTPTVSHAQVLRSVTSASGGQFLLATDVAGLNKAFDETYAHDKREKPFSEVLIGKLIIE